MKNKTAPLSGEIRKTAFVIRFLSITYYVINAKSLLLDIIQLQK